MKKYLPIVLLTFVNVIGFSILIPVLPTIAEKYVSEGMVEITYGILLSVYAMFQFIASPALGSLSDKYGRKPMLLLSQAGTTLSWVIFSSAFFLPDIYFGGFSIVIFIIAISRVIDGITGGNISIAQAWVADVTPPENRTKIYGILGATFGIGFLFGPAIGGLTSSTNIGFLGTAIFAFLLSVCTLFFIWKVLPESLPLEKRDKALKFNIRKEINFFYKLRPFKNNTFINRMLLIRVAFALVFSSYTTIIILFISNSFGLSTFALGIVLSVIGVFSIFNQAFLVNKVAKRFGDLKTLYLGILFIFFGLVILPFIPLNTFEVIGINFSLILVIVNSYLFNAGISFVNPTIKSILTKNVEESRQGAITGVDESLLALGQAISPIIAGILFSLFGMITFYVFSFILLLPHFLIYLQTKKLLLEEPVFKKV